MEHLFFRLTGTGTRVGVIDSGFNVGHKDVHVLNGTSFCNGDAQRDSNYKDMIGHGTACIGVIHSKAPNAEFLPVKIFESELITTMDILCKAIYWCVEHHCHIINLSLGTLDVSNSDILKEACDFAHKHQTFIVAATSNDGQPSIPASFPNVFGVAGGKVSGKFDYFYDPQEKIQFVARGDRQRLNWLEDKQIFMGGSSFAAPHISGLIALIIEKYDGITFNDLTEILKLHSLNQCPELVDSSTYAMSEIPRSRPDVSIRDIDKANTPGWIEEAVIFPYNKEMHGLVRFRELLPFRITRVADVVGKRTIGKDSGEVIGGAESNLIIQQNLEDCLQYGDTLVLGYLDEISRIKKRDVLQESLELALKHNKNVYSLSSIANNQYESISKAFEEKHLHYAAPTIDFATYEALTKTYDWRSRSQKPVVGMFGTGPQQGKFTTQLALRKQLQKIGYKVGQLGTEHQSALFDFDFTFPNGYDGQRSIQIPMDLHIPLLNSAMVGIEQLDPDIIIVGGQSGIIPHNFYEKSQSYTLPSLILLFGTVPDAYILLVNSIDEPEFIQENIRVLESLGKGKVILLVFSDKKKIVNDTVHTVVSQPLCREEICQTVLRLESTHCIPATEIISAEGRKKMADVVINFF